MSDKRTGILAAGNWIVDHVKLIDAYPEQDALVFIGDQQSSNGGGPYNVLKDLSKLGAEFPLLGAGLVGDDADGRWILDDCAASGIDALRITPTDRAPTSFTDVMTVAASGRRTFFHQVGANALLEDSDIQLGNCQARFFYLGYLLLLDGLDHAGEDGQSGATRLLRRATSAGYETVVDLVSAQTADFSTVRAALAETDTLFLNEREATGLLGRAVSSADLPEAAAEVLSLGVRKRVVAHCREGAVLVDRDATRTIQGSIKIPAEKIRGAAGAGDAFAAGVIFGLHEEKSPSECLLWGVCAAAGCLFDPTTSGGVRGLADSLKFGSDLGFRSYGN